MDDRCVIDEMYLSTPPEQRSQLVVMVEDQDLNPWAVADALRKAGHRITGTGILKHRAKTCICGGWED